MAQDPVGVTNLTHTLLAAREAQRMWQARPLGERKKSLEAVRERLRTGAQDVACALAADLGKPAGEALTAEVVANVELFDYWLGAGCKALRGHRVRLPRLNYPGKKARVDRLPVGVVGVITPWNFPVALPLRTIVPALLAGNAVLWKPSEVTPQTNAVVTRLFADLLPPDLFVTLVGGAEMGAAVASAGCDHLVFTGSVATGSKVARAAALTRTPVCLELGGKDAAIVCTDADLNRAASGIVWAAFANGGQNCAGIERLYVEHLAMMPLLERLLARVRKLRVGPGGDLPPMATDEQLAKVVDHVSQAVGLGAKVHVGGNVVEGRWFEPTILSQVPEHARILQEETFGPVLCIVEVETAEEAVGLANASAFGLNGSVWARDLKRAEAIARQLHVGVALVNNHSFTGAVPSLPWAGVKDSGRGITSSPYAMGRLTRPRVLLVDSNTGGDLWWYPYSETLEQLARTSLAMLARGTRGKLRAAGRALSLLRQRQRELF